MANSAQPPKAKITRLVCSGRRRPKLVQGRSKFIWGQTSCEAISTPNPMPITPHTTVMMANWRTTL
ncbi:hypothetical protein ACS96_31535 [Pseudomonas aeruginosa]|nr:hypothetical protein ACS96_31535 [Pseudomonas aeruginosa]